MGADFSPGSIDSADSGARGGREGQHVKHALTRAGAVIGAVTLASMVMSPAMAADTVAQADANALTVTIAGEAIDSGTVTATHDGTSETVTGETQPPIGLLSGQDLLAAGTLAQQATADVVDLQGVSAACAGIAGDGATLAEVGDSACLTGGDNVEVTIANLDLTGTVAFTEGSALEVLNAVTDPVLQALIEPLTAELSAALATAVNDNLGVLEIGGTVGVIESWCQADVDSATGGARLADAQVGVTLGDQSFGLLDIPVEPAPNTKVVTDLTGVTDAVITAIETDLTTTLTGILGDLTAVTDAVQAQILDPITTQVSTALAPLEEQLLDITLNKQTRPTADSIEVTALDIQVVPGAEEFVGSSLITGALANVGCGPNSRVAPVVSDDDPAPGDAEGDLPAVPTTVDSGVSAQAGASASDVLLGGAAVLAALAGLVGYRRLTATE